MTNVGIFLKTSRLFDQIQVGKCGLLKRLFINLSIDGGKSLKNIENCKREETIMALIKWEMTEISRFNTLTQCKLPSM